MPASPFELDQLVAVITTRFPELRDARFTLLSGGWDSVAVDADNRLIFKFPRHAQGAEGLGLEASILQLVRRHVALRVPSLMLFEEPQLFSRHDKIAGEHLLAGQYAALNEAARQDLAEQMG